MPNRLPEGRPLPLTRDPEPFALEREPDHASYSPLGVEFGRERRAQWNAGFWTGDMLFSRRYGSAHFAHRALNAVPIRNGVRLELLHQLAAPAARPRGRGRGRIDPRARSPA